MGTNKIQLRTVDEVMADYTPVYRPIYPLFVNAKAQKHTTDVGQHNFKRIEAVGDIRMKRITPKDTEIRQVAVKEGKKTFKKYFEALQFVQSSLQAVESVDQVTMQVLDENQIRQDELFLFGEGTSGADVLNNGLFYSADPNYSLQNSYEIPLATQLKSFHTKVMETASLADQIAGQKVMLFYGNVKPLLRSLHSASDASVRQTLIDALGAGWSVAEIPDSALGGASVNGWIAANLDQTKLHYTEFPHLMDQGVDAKKMEVWANYLQGSTMLEVLANYGVVRQPTTLGV